MTRGNSECNDIRPNLLIQFACIRRHRVSLSVPAIRTLTPRYTAILSQLELHSVVRARAHTFHIIVVSSFITPEGSKIIQIKHLKHKITQQFTNKNDKKHH